MFFGTIKSAAQKAALFLFLLTQVFGIQAKKPNFISLLRKKLAFVAALCRTHYTLISICSMPMQIVTNFCNEIFKNWGFDGSYDYVTTALGIKKTPFYAVQTAAFMIAWLLTFVSEWIWDPPAAAMLLVGMTCANAYYGYLANKSTKGENWEWRKFRKTAHIIASDLLAMAFLHWIITLYPYYERGADVLFAHLAGFRFRELFLHWKALGYKKGSFNFTYMLDNFKAQQEKKARAEKRALKKELVSK